MKIRIVVLAAFACCFFATVRAEEQQPGGEAPKKLDLSFYVPTGAEGLPASPAGGKPRNVILLIGDGMGLGEAYFTSVKTGGSAGRLHFEKMPFTGLARNASCDNLTPDSAASGTSLATGQKTNNRMISTLPDGKKARTIVEALRPLGFATGIVSEKISDATPAVFSSHAAQRAEMPEIAAQQTQSGIDVIIGSGFEPWLPEGGGGMRKDGRNLLDEAKAKGYEIVKDPKALDAAKGAKLIGAFKFPGYLAMPEVPLEKQTRKAISLLSATDKRFFLMVEGAFVDKGGHENNADIVLYQTLLFDMAVKAALEFAAADKQTLVVVTADHETGGLMVLGGNIDGKSPYLSWAHKQHTATPIPVYSYGPGAEAFSGVIDNTEIPKRIAALLDVPATEFPKTEP